ncbi:hypothetical protein [Pyxidicoccus xibeiensis]|uniref:hypothetical protein n=1 Tax=Pyxidicoccus xibeiensis TaxID=2906759 RepID=UPI0020A7EC51|nr:hypothetical protein [Pyxidicoccus xibeiensis]MCP3138365.1 hypothetical protein [Pyxidicoccus xibeiensis]
MEPAAGAAKAPSSEAEASQALDSNLPECDTLEGQSCRITIMEAGLNFSGFNVRSCWRTCNTFLSLPLR